MEKWMSYDLRPNHTLILLSWGLPGNTSRPKCGTSSMVLFSFWHLCEPHQDTMGGPWGLVQFRLEDYRASSKSEKYQKVRWLALQTFALRRPPLYLHSDRHVGFSPLGYAIHRIALMFARCLPMSAHHTSQRRAAFHVTTPL
jgi:hypothetical protein